MPKLPRPIRLALAALSLMAAPDARARAPAAGRQVPQTFRHDAPDSLRMDYLLYLPERYDEGGPWPLVLFLHGSGERGDSLALVAVHGPPRLVREGRSFPSVLVSPQLPRGQYWQPGALHALLDDVVARYRVDTTRVYVTGLSMGGFGTWALAMDRPERFAAIAPVCGGGDVTRACRLANVPTWAFHGALDDVIPLVRSEEMARALQACGGDVRLTVYPDANHDAWTRTYADSALYDWLLSHLREE